MRSSIVVCMVFQLLLLSCSSGHKQERENRIERPNIVWITSEDNSKHFLKLFDPHGAVTPNIEFLANSGIIFTSAYSNSPVCSVARSTLISSCYAPRIGAQFHRKERMVPMPDGIRMFPAYLRDAGYYATNNNKEDYNIIKGEDVWDESSNTASWRNRPSNQPFFHVQNIFTTHESRMHFSEKDFREAKTRTSPDSVFVAPVHPKTELFNYTYALYHNKIQEMDKKVGEIIEQLREDGLLEETIIFYFGDHGGVLPGSKGYLYETGLHVPLVVYVPQKYQKLAGFHRGTKVNGTVSFIDFGATVLNLAGANLPEGIDGKPFLGKGISPKEVQGRDFTFSHADRFDEKYDLVRAIRVGPYKYIRNFEPFNIDALQNNYRYKMLAYEEWRELYWQGELTPEQAAFFRPKPPEALYNIEKDPYELTNLAADPEHLVILERLRARMAEHLAGMPDLSFYPEHVLAEKAFDNPVAFGQDHKEEIGRLIRIADLSLFPYDDVKSELEKALGSENPWERYWGLIACSCFGKEASGLSSQIAVMREKDSEIMNRVRAAEYLALTGMKDPRDVILQALAESDDDIEILEILNIVTLFKDMSSPYAFPISREDIRKGYEWPEIDSRIEYLSAADESQKN